VAAVGWPKPPRSRCWMCPNQSAKEWAEVMGGPDASLASSFEQHIQEKDTHVWLTERCMAVGDQDFSDPNLDLFGSECGSGACFV
jgi:hypothetical protein